jgi:hypothetical protein
LVKTVVKAKKRKTSEDPDDDAEDTVVTAHAIPISEASGRVLLSQTELGHLYYKGYMSEKPLKPLPRELEGATLSSMFQLVCILDFGSRVVRA